MSEELKEILKGMKKASDEDKNLWLEDVSVKLLHNYIICLQEEVSDLKAIIESRE